MAQLFDHNDLDQLGEILDNALGAIEAETQGLDTESREFISLADKHHEIKRLLSKIDNHLFGD